MGVVNMCANIAIRTLLIVLLVTCILPRVRGGVPTNELSIGFAPSAGLFADAATAWSFCPDTEVRPCSAAPDTGMQVCMSKEQLTSYIPTNIFESLYARFDLAVSIESEDDGSSQFVAQIIKILWQEVLGYSVRYIFNPNFGDQLPRCVAGLYDFHPEIWRSDWTNAQWNNAFFPQDTSSQTCQLDGITGVLTGNSWFADVFSVAQVAGTGGTVGTQPVALDFWRAYTSAEGVQGLPLFNATDAALDPSSWYVPPICASVSCGVAYIVSPYYEPTVPNQQVFNLGWRVALKYPPNYDTWMGLVTARTDTAQQVLLMDGSLDPSVLSGLFVGVTLPTVTSQCLASAGTQYPDGNGPYNCDFPSQTLFKVSRVDSDSDYNDARHLFSRFDISREAIKDMLGSYIRGTTLPDAACNWLHNNSAVWVTWLAQATPRNARAGDAIQPSFATQPIVISFVFAVLGSWTSVILLEQALYERNRKKSYHQSLLSSAVPFALCAIWAVVCMAHTQIDLSPLTTITYNPLGIFLMLPPILCLVLVGFWCSITQWQWCGRSATVVAALAPGSLSPADVEADVNFDTDMPSACHRLKQIVLDFARAYHMGSFLGGLALEGAFILAHVLSMASIYCDASVWYNTGVAWSILLCFCFTQTALHCFVYMTQWREFGAFLMAAGLIGTNQIFYGSLIWTYRPRDAGATSPPALMTSGTLTLLACIVAALVCFVLLGLQFLRMKVSHHHLDALLIANRKQKRELRVRLNLKDVDIQEMEQLEQLMQHIRPHEDVDGVMYMLTEWAMDRRTGRAYASNQGRNNMQTSVLRSTNSMASVDTNHRASIIIQLQSFEPMLELTKAFFGPANTSSPARNASLVEILKQKLCVELFKDHCVTNKSTENVAFYLSVEECRRQSESSAKRPLLVERIRREFIEDDGDRSVNLPSKIRAQLLQALHNESTWPTNLFDRAQKEILDMMLRDSFMRFKTTFEYKICCFVLATLELGHHAPI